MESMFLPSTNDKAARKGLTSLKKRMIIHEVFLIILTLALIGLAVLYFFNIKLSPDRSGKMLTPEMRMIQEDSDKKVGDLEKRIKQYEDLILHMNKSIEDMKAAEIANSEILLKKLETTEEKINKTIQSTEKNLTQSLMNETAKLTKVQNETSEKVNKLEADLEEQRELFGAFAIQTNTILINNSLNAKNMNDQLQQVNDQLKLLEKNMEEVNVSMSSQNKANQLEQDSLKAETERNFTTFRSRNKDEMKAILSYLNTTKTNIDAMQTNLESLSWNVANISKNEEKLRKEMFKNMSIILADLEEKSSSIGNKTETTVHKLGNVETNLNSLSKRVTNISENEEKRQMEMVMNVSNILANFDKEISIIDNITERIDSRLKIEENRLSNLSKEALSNKNKTHNVENSVKNIKISLFALPQNVANLSTRIDDLKHEMKVNLSKQLAATKDLEEEMTNRFAQMQDEINNIKSNTSQIVEDFENTVKSNVDKLEDKLAANASTRVNTEQTHIDAELEAKLDELRTEISRINSLIIKLEENERRLNQTTIDLKEEIDALPEQEESEGEYEI